MGFDLFPFHEKGRQSLRGISHALGRILVLVQLQDGPIGSASIDAFSHISIA